MVHLLLCKKERKGCMGWNYFRRKNRIKLMRIVLQFLDQKGTNTSKNRFYKKIKPYISLPMSFKNDQKILLILDIDETLIHATSQPFDYDPAFKIFDYHIYQRPYLLDFFEEIKDEFLIGLWSSASDDYVEAIPKNIIPEFIQLEFIWGRSRCTYRRNIQINDDGYYDSNPLNHYHYIKPLKKLKRHGYDLNRILIVDDSPHKSKDNYGNAIYLNPFIGDQNDTELRLLSKYLQLLKNKENVRYIEKRNWQLQIKRSLK